MTGLIALLLAFQAGAVQEQPPKPLDFTEVSREVEILPALNSAKPLYGLFLFGRHADIRVWAVLDQGSPDQQAYNVLYLDRDADGKVGEEGEQILGDPGTTTSVKFTVGTFAVPGTEDTHQDFSLTWTPKRVSYRMRWRGDKITMGAYGPDGDTYGNFGPSAKEAPIFVPGYDRPFTFERWLGNPMRRGQTTDFKVFVGNRGDRTGAFSTVDDRFLPMGEYPVATLLYTDGDGKEQRYQVKLTERC